MIDDAVKKAFDFAADTTKQLITLSSGIIVITVTFQKDVFKDLPNEAKVILYISWLLYFLSILFGILTMMALTGTLEKNSTILHEQTDEDNGSVIEIKGSIRGNILKPTLVFNLSKVSQVDDASNSEKADDESQTRLSIYSSNITWISSVQVVTFALAVG